MEFFELFGDVLLYPLDPTNLVLEDNPLVLSCLTVLIGMAVVGMIRGVYVKMLGCS